MTRPDFKFKTKPYDHQSLVFDKTKDEIAYALFLDMGCGKSKVLLDTAAYLYCEGKINGLVVLAPKGVYGNWVAENDGQVVTHVHPDILEHSSVFTWQSNHATKKFQEAWVSFLNESQDKFSIFVMNAEALRSKPAIRAMVDFLKSRQVLLAVDEATIIKNYDAQVTQKIIRLGRGAKYRRILTGTPVTNSPLDIFAPYEFLDPNILGFTNYFTFRARYANLSKVRMGQKDITVIRGYQRQDELRSKLETAAVIMKKEDCLDLPEKVYMTRDVELSPNQSRHYTTMKEISLAELKNGEVITAEVALTKLLRLHQITLGFLTVTDEDTGIVREVPLDDDGGPRIQALMDVLDEIGPDEKVIIWANYVYNINTITDALRARYEPRGSNARVVEKFDGSTPSEDRKTIVSRFQDKEDPLRYIVGNPRVGGFGITLTASANTVYYSNNYSLEIRKQSEDRTHRIGQTRSSTYTDLRAKNTIDEMIVKALQDKENLAEALTGGGWERFLRS